MFSVRYLKQADYIDIHKIWTDPEVVKMTYRESNTTLEQTKLRVEQLINSDTISFVAVAYDGEVIATGGYNKFISKKASHVAEINIMVRSDFHNKGVGTILFGEMLKHAEDNGVKVVELKCHTDNLAGIALYKKFGFESEGVLRKRVFRDGEYRDIFIMSKIF